MNNPTDDTTPFASPPAEHQQQQPQHQHQPPPPQEHPQDPAHAHATPAADHHQHQARSTDLARRKHALLRRLHRWRQSGCPSRARAQEAARAQDPAPGDAESLRALVDGLTEDAWMHEAPRHQGPISSFPRSAAAHANANANAPQPPAVSF